MLRSTRLLGLVLSLSIATPFAAPALAQAPSATADTLLKKGKEQFAKKSYAEARASFSAAYDASPTGHAAYWAGRASQELHEIEVAADWYGKAMAAGKLGPGEDAAARFDALSKEAVTVVFETNPDGATVRIDGKEFAQKTPFYAHLAPGKHQVVVEVGGKSASREVDVVPYKKARVEITVEGAAKAEPPSTPEATPIVAPVVKAPVETVPERRTVIYRTPLKRQLAYITAGGAIVALGLGTMYGIKALSDDRAFEKDPTPEREDIGRRHALVSDISLVLGAGLAVTSVVLFLTSKPREESIAFVPAVSPTFAGGSLSFKF
jgi:hypothetical protein